MSLTQPQALHQPHPGAVEEGRDEAVDAARLVQQLAHLAGREDDRQLPGRARGGHLVEPGELDAEYLAVEEQQRGTGLGLGRCGDVALVRQVAQEVGDLPSSELHGLTLPMEEDETPAPVDIGLLGAIGVVAKPDGLAKAIEKADRRPSRRIDRRGRTGWTIPAGDATIQGRRLAGSMKRHGSIFGPLCIHSLTPPGPSEGVVFRGENRPRPGRRSGALGCGRAVCLCSSIDVRRHRRSQLACGHRPGARSHRVDESFFARGTKNDD
jgi:hypothetical protein